MITFRSSSSSYSDRLSFAHLLFLLSLTTTTLVERVWGLGGETLTYTTIPFTNVTTHRQNVCDRYDAFRSGQIQLRYALEGLQLRPLIAVDDFFFYDEETGINSNDPGLTANLMDELAERAGFTWRESFGISYPPGQQMFTWPEGKTWTDMLLWSVDTYDVAVSWWDQTVERMERGVAYIEPWFDGSVILIDQADPPIDTKKISLFNFLRPFDSYVWLLTLGTVLLSGVVYQLIEYFHEERNERSLWQWFSDNLYLSSLNFTQNFEYAPNSVSGRIFGVSMGIWALLMTATYTANLASLLVDQKQLPLVVDSIDQAVVLGIPICTYATTNADVLIRETYPNAQRVPKISELEAYKALRNGECGLVAGYKDNWLGYQLDKDYNPDCDLEWVGRTVEIIKSGFAVKADAGYLCTSFIRDVFNLHLTEMISDGFVEQAWDQHRSKTANPSSCADSSDWSERRGRQRRLANTASSYGRSYGSSSSSSGGAISTGGWGSTSRQRRRQLKGGGSTAAAASSSSGEDGIEGESLSIQQMAGTFFLHFVLMILALLTSFIHYIQSRRETKESKLKKQKSVRAFRTHGPIIGSPPQMNTFVSSERLEQQQQLQQQKDYAQDNTSMTARDQNGSWTRSDVEQEHSRRPPQVQFASQQQKYGVEDMGIGGGVAAAAGGIDDGGETVNSEEHQMEVAARLRKIQYEVRNNHEENMITQKALQDIKNEQQLLSMQLQQIIQALNIPNNNNNNNNTNNNNNSNGNNRQDVRYALENF